MVCMPFMSGFGMIFGTNSYRTQIIKTYVYRFRNEPMTLNYILSTKYACCLFLMMHIFDSMRYYHINTMTEKEYFIENASRMAHYSYQDI